MIAANISCISCLIFKVDISADLGDEGEKDIGGDWDHFNLRFIIPGLVARPVCPIAFPNHCILSVFDLHDEQMISFS